MHKLVTVAVLSTLFAGSVMADDIGMEEQKRQMEMNERAARGELGATMPDASPAQPDIPVEDGRDVVGMPLDDANTEGETIGGDHIVEMSDSPAPDDNDDLSIDGDIR